MLFDLPTGLAAELLIIWLEVADRVQLDSACCSAAVRGQFMEVLQSPECASKSWIVDSINSTKHAIEWANARHVSFQKISICSDCEANTYENYFGKFGGRVTDVRVNYAVPKTISTIALCQNLINLEMTLSDLPCTLRGVLTYCKQLRKFRCDMNHSIRSRSGRTQSDELEGLSCPNLKVVDLSWEGFAQFAAAILRLAVGAEAVILRSDDYIAKTVLAAVSPTVTALSLHGNFFSEKCLHRMFQQCANIMHLDLHYRLVTGPFVQTMSTQLQQLKSVNLSYMVNLSVVRSLAHACGDRLTELLLCQCHFLTLRSVQEILPLFTQLTSFGTYYSEYSSGPTNFSLLSRFSTLTVIYGGSRKGVAFVEELAASCPDVEHLHLDWFDGAYTGYDVDVLVQNCPKLRSLNVKFRKSYDSKVHLAQWRKIRPELVVTESCAVRLTALRDCMS